jgi:hypothetical protein
VIPKIDPKEDRTDGREVPIEIYIGFVHVDFSFYYFAYIGKSTYFKSEFDFHPIGGLFITLGNYFK